MKPSIQSYSKLWRIVFFIAVSATIMSCNDEKLFDPTILTGKSKVYTLNSASSAAIRGTINFTERNDHSTLVTIELDGTTSGNLYPVNIRANSAAETGDIVIALNPVDGKTGRSETIVKEKLDGTIITYDELLVLDAYVIVQQSGNEVAILAQSDVGSNETTTTSRMYTLHPVTDSDVSGFVRFTKRVNGNTLIEVNLTGASPTGYYPVYICENSYTIGGPSVINLTPVIGGLGISYSNIDQLNNGNYITYDQLTGYNGHIRVATPESVPKTMALTNIGSNQE
ncbi:MAG: hypothetical protein ABI663_19905 [Chryseolinea sp.]